VKSKLCERLSSSHTEEIRNSSSNTIKWVTVNDTTDKIRKKCLEDDFSKIDENKKSISIRQYFSRYDNGVSGGETNCLGI
jgi:hypothetical protein